MPYTPCMPCIPQPMPCRLPVTKRMIQTMSAMKKIRQSRPINRPPKPKPIIPRPPPYLPNSIISIISPFRGAPSRPCTFYFLYASYRGFVHSIVKVKRLTTVVWLTGQLRRFQVAVFERNVLVGAEVQVVDQDEIVRKGAERPDDRTFCNGIGQDSGVGEGFDALDDAAGAFDTPRDLGVAVGDEIFKGTCSGEDGT